MSRNVLKRQLAGIELLLIWEGEISSARLSELLTVHRTQVSDLILQYRTMFPLAARPNKGRWGFTANRAHLKPKLTDGSLKAYVAVLNHGEIPSVNVEVAEPLQLDPSSKLFARVSKAMRKQQGIVITYRSFARPKQHELVIFPHAMVQSQGRWHVRAFCRESNQYQDFVMGWINQVVFMDEVYEDVQVLDKAWHTWVNLSIGVHPALSPQAQSLVKEERFKGATGFVQKTRAAFAHYVLDELRVAINIKKQLPPDYLLALKNKKAVEKWLLPNEEG
jgi:WYL domain